MRWIGLGFAVVIASCAAPLAPPSAESEQAIIGGTPSAEADYPATGALLVVAGGGLFGQVVCTGTLIAPDVVLTAAHCTLDPTGGAITLEYYFSFSLDVSAFGQSTTQLPPRTTKARSLAPHPDFDINGTMQPLGLGDFKDIGLIFLDAPVTDVDPAPLAEAGQPLVVGDPVQITGYGVRTANGMEAGIKYQANTWINEVGAAEMQIGDLPPTPQKCHGDSGGPTYLEPSAGAPLVIIGVTSRAYDQSDCERGGVDTRVETHLEWIAATMAAACQDGTRPTCSASVDAGAIDSGAEPDAAAPSADAAVPPIDAGASLVDAGASLVDAGAPAGDAHSGTTDVGGQVEREDGCGCRAASGPPPAESSSLLLLLAFALLLRRRSSGRGA